MQEIAWNISLWLMLLLAATFIFVVMKSGDKADAAEIQSGAGKIRTALFLLILVVGVPITIMTLSELPYEAQASGKTQIVKVVGSQFSWDLSSETVVAGRPVQFRVEAADASHGFAIYDDSMRLLAQTQAMPGYTNLLNYTFAKAGTYKILCLEYCGMGHHNMSTEITVTGGVY